ncbi:MAG: sulfatase [Myxococcota bacterium]
MSNADTAAIVIEPASSTTEFDLADAPGASGRVDDAILTIDLPSGGSARATLSGLDLRPRQSAVMRIQMRVNGYGNLTIGGVTWKGREKIVPILPTDDFVTLRLETLSMQASDEATTIELVVHPHGLEPFRLEVSEISFERENAEFKRSGNGFSFIQTDVPAGRVLETAKTGINGVYFYGPGSIVFRDIDVEESSHFFSRLLVLDASAGSVRGTLIAHDERHPLFERAFERGTRELFLSAPLDGVPTGRYDLEVALSSDAPLLVGMNPMIRHGRDDAAAPRHVIVYVSDALRADHLPAYGYERMTAPYLTRLARESLVVEHCYTAATYTKSSVPGVFTGLYAANHRVFDLGHSLPHDVGTLFEQFQRYGYLTVLAHQGPNPGPQTGLHRDADVWFLSPHGGDRDSHGFAYLNERVLELFEQYEGVPLAVYLHNNGPHSPWEPSPALDLFDRFNDSSAWGHRESQEGHLGFQRAREPNDTARVEALYDADVLQADLHYGMFVERLVQMGLLEKSILFFTSDHGDTLHEDYPDDVVRMGQVRLEHGTGVHESQARIPMIITAPGLIGAGRMGGLMVNLDIFPSAFGLLGFAASSEPDGEDLSGVMRGGASSDAERVVFVRGTTGRDARIAALEGHLKLILNAATPAESLLVDLREDRYEREDVRSEHPDAFDRLLELALAYREREMAPTASTAPTLDADSLEALRGLGYLQ